MALVEDDHPETRAQVIHVKERGVVGGHGERTNVVLAAPYQPDRPPERYRQKIVPLAHQIERGRDHERAAALVVDRHDRDVALASAGGQDDDAATSRPSPSVERLGLVRT